MEQELLSLFSEYITLYMGVVYTFIASVGLLSILSVLTVVLFDIFLFCKIITMFRKK